MANYIIMPRLGLTMEEGVITKWCKQVGDAVAKGEVIADIESDKSVVPYECPEEGTVLAILAEEGDTLECNAPIAIVGEAGEDISGMTANSAGSDAPSVDAADGTTDPAAETSSKDYDVVVIGAGPGGYVAAIKAAQMGRKTCIIEKEHFGGTCLNIGCIPTKALIKSAEVFKEVKEAAAFGVNGVDPSNITIDMNAVQNRKKQVVKTLVGGVQGLLRKNGVTVKNGTAEFISDTAVKVADETITAGAFIIATGSQSKSLPIDIDPAMPVMTSTEALVLTEIPARTAVIGGGVIGVELASFLAGAGSKVTIVEFLDKILPMVDKEITDIVVKDLMKEGIVINTSARVMKIEKDAVIYEKDGAEHRVECDAVLMAVGRGPCTDGLGIENTSIKTDRGAIITDDRLQTNVKNIYAIGDVNGKLLLAHTASAEGLVAVENICGIDAQMDYDHIPSVIYIQPEIASVGLTEEQAREKYGDIKVGKFPVTANGKALIEGETRGIVKIITDEKHLEIVGAHLYCVHASDMIAELTVAMDLECTADELIKMVHPHPSVSEVIAEAAHAAESKAIHC